MLLLIVGRCYLSDTMRLGKKITWGTPPPTGFIDMLSDDLPTRLKKQDEVEQRPRPVGREDFPPLTFRADPSTTH